MPKQKYDWTDLKQKFLASDYAEVKSFLSDQWVPYNSKTKALSKWWWKEKKANKNKALVVATENSIKKQAKELEIPIDQLTIAKKNAVVKVINLMMDNKNPLDLSDLEKTIKILRTEMWLPTSYAKNENLNTDRFTGIDIVWVKEDDDKKEI